MKRMIGLALALLMGLSAGALANTPDDEMAVWLSEPLIAIDSGFSGARLFIFGGVSGEARADGIIVVVRGPEEEVAIRKRERVAGFWLSGAPNHVAGPSFYFADGTDKIEALLTPAERARLEIGADALDFGFSSVPQPEADKIDNKAVHQAAGPDLKALTAALVADRQRSGVFIENVGATEMRAGSLFRTTIDLPSNTPVGIYQVEVYGVRGGEAIVSAATPFNVDKIGLERGLYDLAHKQSFVYGLLSVAIALVAGWTAAAVFRQ
ncbi:MAG: TIGR02186 family protein [Pseudomonadota bacterium]